jgi:dihydroorotate dehydrogenase
MPYSILRRLLFLLPAEAAHHVALKSLRGLQRCGCLPAPVTGSAITLWGLHFPNRIGLAAGLDKNGEYIDALAAMGFGFIEIGTVTPKPQPGNPKPRLFRLPQARALINRMGFNNHGVDYLIQQKQQSQYRGIVGINIGKNASTPLEQAADDYVLGLQKAYPHASYITVNISSPNTAGLRQLQAEQQLNQLLQALKAAQQQCAAQHHRYVPLLIKIAPDLTADEVNMIASLLIAHNIDGVIATNTTLSREEVAGQLHSEQAGGLSGAPLFKRSLAIVQQLYQHLQGKVPIIACGGISSQEQAEQMLTAGASLLQVYTGFIYQGPSLIKALACCGKVME